MRHWASGVAVVTTRRAGGIQGITVSSFTSLSLDPPLVLICINRTARSHRLIATRKCFAVNVLRAGQKELADLAAGRHGAKGNWLNGMRHRKVATGAPVLEGCLAFFDCTLVDRFRGGTHTIFVGRVEAAGSRSGRPLLWHDRGYRRVAKHGRETRAKK